MTTRDKIALIICILVHAVVVWNVYEFDQMTPRVINISCEELVK